MERLTSAVTAAQLWARDRVQDAWNALRSGQPSEAEIKRHTKAVEKAVELEPTIGAGHRVLGLLYINAADMAAAEQQQRKATELESSVEPLVRVAKELLYRAPDKAKEVKAEDLLKQALELDPGSDEAWFELGVVELRLEKWADAASAFDRVSPAAQRFADAVHRAGSIRFTYLDDYQGAYVRLTRAAQLAPDNLEILANYTEALFALGRFDQTSLAAARARGLSEAQQPDKAFLRAALSFYLVAAGLLGGDHEQALLALDRIEVEVKATSAGEQSASWNYADSRRVLEQLGMSPAQRDALMKVLDHVESNGESGSLDDMRRVLRSR